MKKLIILIFVLLLFSCNTTQLVDTWKNPEISTYAPAKVLVVGLTSHEEARIEFENKLKQELELRGVEAIRSIDVLNDSLMSERLGEEDLKALESQLLTDGYDTILFSKVIGVEDKIVYKKNYDGFDETYQKFREDYLRYQDIYYNPDYYNEYTVYHAETSMYCICPSEDRELIWKGYIDIVDPRAGDDTIKNYVNLIIAVLEEEQLISPIELLELLDEKPMEEIIN